MTSGRVDPNRAVEPPVTEPPLGPIPEPNPDEEAARRLFDRTVDQPYRGMLDAEVEVAENDNG